MEWMGFFVHCQLSLVIIYPSTSFGGNRWRNRKASRLAVLGYHYLLFKRTSDGICSSG